MTIDKAKLRALADAFPEGLDFDSNTEPFFNGPSGESLGGGSTGFYSVYGQPFEIEGDQYDGTEYVSICTREFAEFICSARDGILALLDEIERLDRESQNLSSQLGACDRDRRAMRNERDQLKVQNEALHQNATRWKWLEGAADPATWESIGCQAEMNRHLHVDAAMVRPVKP